MSKIKILLGKRIRELRKERNITQEKLSELAEIEIPSLSNIENGKNYPNSETLEKLARALDVMPYELYIFEHLRLPDTKKLISEMCGAMEKNEQLTRKIYNVYRSIK